MKNPHLDNMPPVDTTIPEFPSLIVLIGAAGSGKSMLASTWPDTQVLELDRFRGLVSDDAGCQQATDDAVFALQVVLDARLARKLTTVVDATNTEAAIRTDLLGTARRHGMPTVALIVGTAASVCVDRQRLRPVNRRVPEAVVRAQHTAAVDAFRGLRGEGFDHVVVADNIHRLQPLLQRVSDTRRSELGWDDSAGLGDLLLVRRTFGHQVLPMWRWKDGSQIAGSDRVGEIRLGPDRLTLALRTDVDGLGDIGFDVLLPCPVDAECLGKAWAPVYSATDLLRALTGEMDQDPDIVCTLHGPHEDEDQDDDPEGRQDLYEQYADAVRP